jgi:hypothetical protein
VDGPQNSLNLEIRPYNQRLTISFRAETEGERPPKEGSEYDPLLTTVR